MTAAADWISRVTTSEMGRKIEDRVGLGELDADLAARFEETIAGLAGRPRGPTCVH